MDKPDEKTQQRIHELARSLKDLHLVASMEEALKKAREIITSTNQEEKSIKELMEETKQARKELSSAAEKEHKGIVQDFSSAEKDKSATVQTKEQLDFDVKTHKLEKGTVEDAMKEVDDIACAVKDTNYIVKEAEKIQKKKK